MSRVIQWHTNIGMDKQTLDKIKLKNMCVIHTHTHTHIHTHSYNFQHMVMEILPEGDRLFIYWNWDNQIERKNKLRFFSHTTYKVRFYIA